MVTGFIYVAARYVSEGYSGADGALSALLNLVNFNFNNNLNRV